MKRRKVFLHGLLAAVLMAAGLTASMLMPGSAADCGVVSAAEECENDVIEVFEDSEKAAAEVSVDVNTTLLDSSASTCTVSNLHTYGDFLLFDLSSGFGQYQLYVKYFDADGNYITTCNAWHMWKTKERKYESYIDSGAANAVFYLTDYGDYYEEIGTYSLSNLEHMDYDYVITSVNVSPFPGGAEFVIDVNSPSGTYFSDSVYFLLKYTTGEADAVTLSKEANGYSCGNVDDGLEYTFSVSGLADETTTFNATVEMGYDKKIEYSSSKFDFTTLQVETYGTYKEVFPDELFRKLVLYYMNVNRKDVLTESSPVYNSDLYEHIVKIYEPNSEGEYDNLQSLEGIQYCTGLESIVLNNCSISDISDIDWSGLDRLYSISLEGNEITSIPDLTGCSSLMYIFFDENWISDQEIARAEKECLPSAIQNFSYDNQHKIEMLGYSLEVGNIDEFKYKVYLTGDVEVGDGNYLTFNLDGKDIKGTYLGTETVNDNTCYVYSTSLGAKQINDEMKISFYRKSGTVEMVLGSSSVRDYADYLLANEQITDAQADFVKTMLNYGGYAQEYFDYNTTDLANDGLYTASTDPVLTQTISESELAGFAASGDYSTDDSAVSFVGASLTCLNDSMGLNLYFTDSAGLSAKEIEAKYDVNVGIITSSGTISYDTVLYDTAVDSGFYVIHIEGISSKQLGSFYEIKMAGVEDSSDVIDMKYSPSTYLAAGMQNGANVKLQNLCKAMYLYGKAAGEY